MYKPFSQACENNKEPIRQVLQHYLSLPATLLEIGSGTGQHAVYMSQCFPGLYWQSSDCAENIAGIESWITDCVKHSPPLPIELDINTASWQIDKVDYLFSANTLHIMSWQEVEILFAFVPTCLKDGGQLFLYGPFNYQGQFTSESNARFNDWLRSQAPHRAIRDFEAILQLANTHGLSLVEDHEMPANNRLLIWQLNETTSS